MAATDLADLLQSAGGWGLSSILMIVITFLVKYVMRLQDEREKRASEHNSQMLSMLEKKIEVDTKYEHAFNNLSRMIERIIDKM